MKSADVTDLLNPLGLAAITASDLWFYRGMMTLFVPAVSWSFGTSWMRGLKVWPPTTTPFLPPTDQLVTFSMYSVAPGAIFYDVLDAGDLGSQAVKGAIALAANAESWGGAESVIAAEEAMSELTVGAIEFEAASEAASVGIAEEADVIGSIGLATAEEVALAA